MCSGAIFNTSEKSCSLIGETVSYLLNIEIIHCVTKYKKADQTGKSIYVWRYLPCSSIIK